MAADSPLPGVSADYSAWLSGRHNRLWRWGEHALCGTGPAGWREELKGWLRASSDPSRWTGYGARWSVAREFAGATGAVILAAGALDDKTPHDFLAHLRSACRSFATAMGCPAAPEDAAPPQQFLTDWDADPSRTHRLRLVDSYLTASGKTVSTPAADMVRSALSDLVEPGSDDRSLLGRLKHRVRLPVTFVVDGALGRTDGRACTLTVEWFVRASPLQLVRDPAALGCRILGREFADAERAAWSVAERSFAGGGFVRWGLDLASGADCTTVDGNSAGGALAAALVALAEGRQLDRVAILACLDETGQAAGTPSVRLGKVQGVEAKASAAFHELRVGRVVLWQTPATGVTDDPDVRARREDSDRVVERIREENPELIVERMGTVRDVVDRLSGLHAGVTDFLRRVANKGLARHVRFRPDYWPSDRLHEFLLIPRVVDEDEYERLTASRRGRDLPGTILDRDYLSEEALRRNDGVRARSLADVWRASTGHIVVRGEPGEGKTTGLWQLVVAACRALADRIDRGEVGTDTPGSRVPLALPLNEVTTEPRGASLVQQALDFVMWLAYGDHPRPVAVIEWLDHKRRTEEFELYLDALDELAEPKDAVSARPGRTTPREWLREQLLELCRQRVLLTTRMTVPLRDLLSQPTRLRMVPLEPRQVREYLGRYFDPRFVPDGAAVTRELRQRLSLSPGPRQLVRLPLLLAVLCELRREDLSTRFPSTRTTLLRLGVLGLLEHGDRRRGFGNSRDSRNEGKLAVLSEVAWRFHAREPLPMGAGALRDVLEEHRMLIRLAMPADGESLLREFLEDGILVPRGVDEQTRERRYGFLLRSFHEYCLAGWIAHQSPSHGDHERFVRMVRGGGPEWGRDWDPEFQPHTAAEWNHIWPLVAGQLKNRARWLIALGDNDLKRVLVACEAPPNCEERIALVNRLVAQLHDQDTPEAVRGECATGLGVLGGAEALAALIQGLDDSKAPSSVREECALALGVLGGPEALAALVQRLNHSKIPQFVQWRCASALGVLGGPEALAALIQRLNDSSIPGVERWPCASALGVLGGPEALAALVQRLNDSYTLEFVRRWCACGLADLGGPEALAALVQRLDDSITPESVRSECARMLGVLGGPEALAALVQRLDDSNTPETVRRACAYGLGTLGGPEALAVLVQRLNNPCTSETVRRACASGLGDLGGPEALAALIPRLDDSKAPSSVREECASALRVLGGSEALAALVQRLNDSKIPQCVRRWCASALGDLGGPEALAALVQRIGDSITPKSVRRACAFGLGKLGGPEALATLRVVREDPDTPPMLRKECAKALRRGEG